MGVAEDFSVKGYRSYDITESKKLIRMLE